MEQTLKDPAQDPAGKLALLRKTFDEKLKLYEGYAQTDPEAAKSCLVFLGKLQPYFQVSPQPSAMEELLDQVRLNQFARACAAKGVGNFENLEQATIEVITRTMQGLRNGEISFAGLDSLHLAKALVEIDQRTSPPGVDRVRDLAAWQRALENTPQELISHYRVAFLRYAMS